MKMILHNSTTPEELSEVNVQLADAFVEAAEEFFRREGVGKQDLSLIHI